MNLPNGGTKIKKILFNDETLHELKKSVSESKIKEQVNYNSKIVGIFIVWYQYNALMFQPETQLISKSLRDYKDNMFLQLAVVSQANYIITHDKDLLVLKSIGTTKIVTPKQFIVTEFPQLL